MLTLYKLTKLKKNKKWNKKTNKKQNTRRNYLVSLKLFLISRAVHALQKRS